MEKKRKYSKFLILPILALILVICSLPASAVSVDGYFSNSAYSQSKMPDNQFATTFPCDVNLMYNLTSGNDSNNITLKTESYKTIEGAAFENGTFIAPTVRNSSFDTIEQDVYNGTVVGDKIIDYNYLDIYSYEFSVRNLSPSYELENQYSRPVLQVNTADCVFIDTVGSDSALFPYGVMLHAENINLDLLSQNRYKNLSQIGSVGGYGNLVATASYGGILIENVPFGWFDNRSIQYDIVVRSSRGFVQEFNFGIGDVYAENYATQLSNGNYNLRIPLLPNEFADNLFTGANDYVTIESVDVNFFSGLAYTIEGNNGGMYVWVLDNVLLTDSHATGDYIAGSFTNVKFDESYIGDVIANIQKRITRNTLIVDNEWSKITRWLAVAVGGFLDVELFYGITFGGILLVCLAFGFLFFFLKYFAGG